MTDEHRTPVVVGIVVADELFDAPVWEQCFDAITHWIDHPPGESMRVDMVIVHPLSRRLVPLLDAWRGDRNVAIVVNPVTLTNSMREEVELPRYHDDPRFSICADVQLVRNSNVILLLHEYGYRRDPRFLPILTTAHHEKKDVFMITHAYGISLYRVAPENVRKDAGKIMGDWHTHAVECIPPDGAESDNE